MTIAVNTPDGGQALFPDGTSPDVMKAALQKKFGGPSTGLGDFRARYPQYNNLSDDELKDKLYKKYYADKMPRSEFDQKTAAGSGTGGGRLAQNPDTGEVLFLDNGQWKPAQRAVNPKTGEMVAYDGKDWVPVDNVGAKNATQQPAQQQAQPQSADNASPPLFSKAGLSRTASNIIPSAENLVKGVASTAVGAAGALVNPDPRAKLEYIKNIAVGTYEGLKQRYGKGLGEAIESDPVGVIADVLTVATGLRGGRAVGETPPPSKLAPAAQRAITEYSGALKSDQASLKGVSQTLQDRPGVATPADMGGQNVLAQVERLANTSTSAPAMQKFLTERQQGQLDRISNDLTSLAGTKRTALQATQKTMQDRAASAAPAYRSAYTAGDRAIWSPELERLSAAPSIQSAMRGAVSMWKDNAIADGYGAMNPSQVDRGGQLTFGKSVPVFPNLQFWDYTKRLVDQKLSVAKRQGATDTVRRLTVLSKSLRSELDKQVPQYAQARKLWSDPSSYLDALDTGRDILKRNESAEEMQANFNSLSEADKQGYREAAVSSILNSLSNNPAKLADLTRILRSDSMRKKITAIMPTPAAKAAWNRRLDFEVKSSELVGAGLKNSATARRLAQMQEGKDMVDDLVLGVARAATGSVKSEVLKAAVLGWGKIRDRLRSSTDTELTKLLTGKQLSKAPPKPTPFKDAAPAIPLLGSVGGLQSQSPGEQ